MCDAHIGLLGPTQIRLWYKHMTHTQHAQAAELFGCVEHNGRETRRHFGVQTNLNTCLYFVFALHKQIQQFLGIDHSLTEVGHQPNECCIPFVNNL